MKKIINEKFDLFIQKLSDENKNEISAFFNELSRHCILPQKEYELFENDFKNAILYYSSINISISEALKLLNIKKLGGFYSRPASTWYNLDDAAKIYPLSMEENHMAVFRLSFYLKEEVVPEILQIALHFIIKRFPSFAVTVKKGFFWHYLNSTKRRYIIKEENDIPCQALKISSSNSQTFRVIYYKNRISVEFFHILTDGTGGSYFLEALVFEYLRLLGIEAKEKGIINIDDVPSEEEVKNEFSTIKEVKNSSGFVDKVATQIGGSLSKNRPCQILHFKMNSEKVAKFSKENNATITAYILSKIFLASKYSTDELNGEFNIEVPVNMRKFYPSKTLRNFSMYCGIRIPINEINKGNELLEKISNQLKEKSSLNNMTEMMNSTKKMINALKYIPLVIKAPVAKFGYGFLGDKIFSSTLSNLGIINIPKELENHIESADFILGPSLTSRLSCTLVSCNKILTLSITKMTKDPSFEENLYKLLTEDNIEVDIEGSPLYEN